MAKRKNKSPIKVPTAKVSDQPTTRGMLKLVRDELKEETLQVKQELKHDIAEVRRELEEDMSQIKQMVHRSNVLVEKQNANTHIVLEGLQALWQ